MGGRTPDPPKQFSPMEQAQAQLAIDNAAAKRESDAAARAAAAKAAEEAAGRTRTQGAVNQAYQQGQTFGQNRVNSLGYADNYGLLDAYNELLTGARSSVPQVSDSVGSYFNYDDLWSKATNRVQDTQRTKLDNAYRGITKPGWESGYFADTADDPILEAILGDQYGQSFDKLDAARARGQLSQGAFDNSLRGLDTKKESAMSTLQDLGGGR